MLASLLLATAMTCPNGVCAAPVRHVLVLPAKAAVVVVEKKPVRRILRCDVRHQRRVERRNDRRTIE